MNLKQFKGQAFTIPNILCYIRLALIPVFIIFFSLAESHPHFYITAAAIVLVSGATDLFDGFIARHFNQCTALGCLLDPLADKLTSITVAICLCFKIPVTFFLALLYCLKEGAMILGGMLLLKSGREIPGSRWFGKVSTFVFYTSMLFMVAAPYEGGWVIAAFILTLVNMVMICFSFFMYLPIFWDLWNQPVPVKENATEGAAEK